MSSEQSAFVLRVLRLMAEHDNCDGIWWRTDGEYAPVTFFINCNDLLFWGCADCERVTPENIDRLEQAYLDCLAAGDKHGLWGNGVFCARVRQMRPQGACYPKNSPTITALLDACGPKRDVDLGNPHKHPDDGGGYAYSGGIEIPPASDAVARCSTNQAEPPTRA